MPLVQAGLHTRLIAFEPLLFPNKLLAARSGRILAFVLGLVAGWLSRFRTRSRLRITASAVDRAAAPWSSEARSRTSTFVNKRLAACFAPVGLYPTETYASVGFMPLATSLENFLMSWVAQNWHFAWLSTSDHGAPSFVRSRMTPGLFAARGSASKTSFAYFAFFATIGTLWNGASTLKTTIGSSNTLN